MEEQGEMKLGQAWSFRPEGVGQEVEEERTRREGKREVENVMEGSQMSFEGEYERNEEGKGRWANLILYSGQREGRGMRREEEEERSGLEICSSPW